jgi:2,3-bisphosphoglycerate-independent phosphoglycerate mutase
VMVVTGDHASPSILAGHGWQPVPVLLASRYAGADPVTAFNERACAAGTLGILPAQHLMPLVMANALRLTKFGA